MLLRRIYQFLIIYTLGLTLLFVLKGTIGLSDYVIPGPWELLKIFKQFSNQYLAQVMNTLSVAVIGQIASILMAFLVGIVGRQATWFGSFIKVTAYNVQAYPIVAIAPIIFILLGDGILTRPLIKPFPDTRIGAIDVDAWKQTEAIMLKQKQVLKSVHVENVLHPY